MNDPNITMEEYIRLEEEKARKHGKVFNWETARYGKIWYEDDIDDLKSVETEFPAIVFNDNLKSEETLSCEPTNEFLAIVYNDALTSKSDFLTEPTVSPQHIDEIDLKNETSSSECNEEEQNVLYINGLFPFNLIFLDDSKLDKDNDDDKIDIIQSSMGNKIKRGVNVLSETSHDKMIKTFKTRVFVMNFKVNIVTWIYLPNEIRLCFIMNLYVPFGISFDPKRYYKDGDYAKMLRKPRDEVNIEDWTSNDEDDVCAVKTVSSVKTNVTEAVTSQDDKSGQTSQKQGISFKKSPEPRVKNVVNTRERVVKPVWDYGKRVNHQNFSKNWKYPHAKRTFNPSAVLTRAGLVNTDRSNVSTTRSISTARSISTVRPIYTVRPVSTARPLASKIAQSNSVIRPNHPRLDIVRPKASNSPIKRSYFTQPVYRPKDLKPDVKTFGVKNMTTVGTRAVVSKGKVENVLKKAKWGNPEILLQDHAVVDSGCSSHMTGNKAYLSDYEDFTKEKPNESVGFTEVMDFPKGTSLRYALTHNPTIYDSLVKQFWQTATVRTLANGIQQLVASIDSKEYTITKASVRSKLQLADAT
ncbi:hypothetical protein Tco_1401748 [Tanacetum coccineum]